MSDAIIIPITHIERKPNSNKYRVVNKGVTVDFLATFLNNSDWPVERICEHYGLTLGEVFAAWAFYYDHKEEIDRTMQTGEIETETYFSDHPEVDARRQALIEQHDT